MAKFVLNDERKTNSYGFRVVNSGIDLSRFLNNPVMLDEHQANTSNVIGRWKNISAADGKLTADADFDNEDANTKLISGKVERGFIKGASMGIIFNSEDMRLAKDGVHELTKCQLFEASICAIPSNENSLSLFAKDGHRLTSNEIKMQLSHFKKLNTPRMDLLNSLIKILNMPSEATEQDVIEAVKKLEVSQTEETQKKIDQMLDLAVNEYNLSALDKDFWNEAALKDFDRVESMLINPAKKRLVLSQTIKNTPVKNAENRIAWTLEDYRKKDPKSLENDQALFMKLYEQDNKSIQKI